MTSNAMQAFLRHVAALEARDLDAVVAGYAPTAVLAAGDMIGAGHDHIRAVFAATLDAAADLQPRTNVIEQDSVVFVSFHSTRPNGPDLVGTDTFVVEDGLIVVHTGYNLVLDPSGTPTASPAAERSA